MATPLAFDTLMIERYVSARRGYACRDLLVSLDAPDTLVLAHRGISSLGLVNPPPFRTLIIIWRVPGIP